MSCGQLQTASSLQGEHGEQTVWTNVSGAVSGQLFPVCQPMQYFRVRVRIILRGRDSREAWTGPACRRFGAARSGASSTHSKRFASSDTGTQVGTRTLTSKDADALRRLDYFFLDLTSANTAKPRIPRPIWMAPGHTKEEAL